MKILDDYKSHIVKKKHARNFIKILYFNNLYVIQNYLLFRKE